MRSRLDMQLTTIINFSLKWLKKLDVVQKMFDFVGIQVHVI